MAKEQGVLVDQLAFDAAAQNRAKILPATKTASRQRYEICSWNEIADRKSFPSVKTGQRT